MSDMVVRVEGLGKRYTLGAQQTYGTLRDAIAHSTRSLGRCLGRRVAASPQRDSSFWALQDVSFAVQQGDRVGIIGRNGAGKSTLLKILSRITEPTRGRVTVQGRVASLLEVGTGFHPELSGRENIFLNGAILGMSKAEIRRKFDEIVAFAEIDQFLDTPVKRYSSGMYVRLAFAVAAHLEPEILVVDEVLAVGDAQFQQKCLGKMQHVGQEGRTVLFVSHNLAALRQLCNSALLLQRGQLILTGPADTVIQRYLSDAQTGTTFAGQVSPYGIELVEAVLEDVVTDQATRSLIFDCNYRLRLVLEAHQPLQGCGVVVRIHDAIGTLVSSLCSTEEGIDPFPLRQRTELVFDLPHLSLFPGQYHASVYLYRAHDPVAYLEAENALPFEVHPAIVRDSMWPYRSEHGVVRLSQAARVIHHAPSFDQLRVPA